MMKKFDGKNTNKNFDKLSKSIFTHSSKKTNKPEVVLSRNSLLENNAGFPLGTDRSNCSTIMDIKSNFSLAESNAVQPITSFRSDNETSESKQNNLAYIKSETTLKNEDNTIEILTEGLNLNNNNNQRMDYSFESAMNTHRLENDIRNVIVTLPSFMQMIIKVINRIAKAFVDLFKFIFIVIITFVLEFILTLFDLFINLFLFNLIFIIGDYFVQPILISLFKNLIEPILKLFTDILILIKGLFQPILDILNSFLSILGCFIEKFRLFNLNINSSSYYNDKLNTNV